MYWEGEILPTLSEEYRTKALAMRSQSDQVGGEEEDDSDDGGTLPVWDDPRQWNPKQVANFIRNIDSHKDYITYAQIFEDNGISGDNLEDLDEEGLEELGIEREVHRRTILDRTQRKL